ncbi:hypothetical protein A2210_01930 [Candidatus Woesebacteria bacterium RIFOXYA1_FULL_40_18]|uniref:Uncharacterized protein n=2 Tax=Candidatus Woeseibacteriota TaxID=1752722 RepID=A0A1F8CII8_9BACT|nr:MAG: hypothetical protein A2210_01930 [Candidatus Woesebacteria bacterium RIFOXYA1_FULL_40_18]OGM88314.1 MAG: hypothetical protein A2614_00360 [Candidatus Woesebacteria bacterium RIFOXYD1_FULL_40_21]
MRAARCVVTAGAPRATVAPSSVPAAIFPYTQCRATTAVPTLLGPESKVQLPSPMGSDGADAVPSQAVCRIRISPAVIVAGQAGDNAAPLVCVETPAPDDE